MSLDADQINFFKEKGYLLLRKHIKKEIVDDLIKENEIICKIVQYGDWPFLNVYNDYVHFSGIINLFGINYPFHKNLSQNIFKKFSKINLKDEILNLTQWKNYKTTLVRLHVFQFNYNYQGAWHRDDNNCPCEDNIQAVIYLKDESGFKLINRKNNERLVEYNIKMTGEQSNPNYYYRKIDKDLIDIIDTRKGDVLIFDPGLIHQGFCKKKRMHYHVRFSKSNNQSIDNFNFINDILPDANINELKKKYIGYQINNTFLSKIKRVKTTLMYFFPRIHFIYKNFSKDKKFKDSILHSTIWQ